MNKTFYSRKKKTLAAVFAFFAAFCVFASSASSVSAQQFNPGVLYPVISDSDDNTEETGENKGDMSFFLLLIVLIGFVSMLVLVGACFLAVAPIRSKKKKDSPQNFLKSETSISSENWNQDDIWAQPL